MKNSGTALAYKLLLVGVAGVSFSSLFWWSWAFGHMIVGYEVCFKEPNPIIAVIEFVTSAMAAIVLVTILKKEVKK